MKPPEYLGPYRIGETLGKGGMGTVFRAKHAKSGEDVAVKLIASQVSDEMKFRRRFMAEIKSLELLSHRNIVNLIGHGEEQGMLFYSMEFVPGNTLQEMIRREKKLEWMTTIDIAIQVCAALKHAHDFGVIHRDLKPANLLVRDDGVVKLLDFGISKIFGNDLTAVGSIMGTADYMAPEQANESGVTARTDLFALGCVMYAMLIGKPPFRGKNITEVITALKQQDPIPLDLIDPHLPDDLVQIVMELLEKKPEDRPPTALAVMNRLKAMRAGLHRLQTLADHVEGPGEDSDRSNSDTTGRRAAKHPRDPAGASDKGASGDTTAPPADRPTKMQDAVDPDRTRAAETIPFDSLGDSRLTAPVNVDPSARTVFTGSRDGNEGTVLGTGVTSPGKQDAGGTDSHEHQTDDSSGMVSVSDTSAGASGKTHFQTVSDGEVRRGYFSKEETKKEHPAARIISIASIVIILLIGSVFVIQSFRGPNAEDLLASIEEQASGEQAFETQNKIERFLKLFPNHPKADELRDRQLSYRVDSAIRLLKLKSNIRPSEGPVYEQAFLDAMALRSKDPAAAKDKLQQWLIVFKDADVQEDIEQLNLGELVAYEVGRLEAVLSEGSELPDDPKLAELMKRIEDAKELPPDERTKLLEGIVTLYDGQDWAQKARNRALEILGRDPGS